MIVYGRDDFDPAIKVAVHPIGAACVDLLFAAVGKVEDAAVFQQATDDTPDMNVFGKPLYTGPQHTDASHDQINPYG